MDTFQNSKNNIRNTVEYGESDRKLGSLNTGNLNNNVQQTKQELIKRFQTPNKKEIPFDKDNNKSSRLNSAFSHQKSINTGANFYKKKTQEIIEIDHGETQQEFNNKKQLSNDFSILDEANTSCKISQYDETLKKNEILKKVEDDKNHPAVDADIKKFAEKNSKKLLEIKKKKNIKVSFNKRESANSQGNDLKDIRKSNASLVEFNLETNKYKKVSMNQYNTNYCSIDITKDNVVERKDVKSRISSIGKSSQKSIEYSTQRQTTGIDDTMISEVNESRLDDDKMNEFKNIRDAHNMFLEYQNIINTNLKDDRFDMDIQGDEILNTQVLDDSLEELHKTEKDLEAINIEIDDDFDKNSKSKQQKLTTKQESKDKYKISTDLIQNIDTPDSTEVKSKSKLVVKCEIKKLKTVEESYIENEEAAFDEEAQDKLKMKLENELGESLFKAIFEIISQNTPEEYFFYEEDKLRNIINERLSDDFKEDKINLGMKNILDIYKLIFAERERNLKLEFC